MHLCGTNAYFEDIVYKLIIRILRIERNLNKRTFVCYVVFQCRSLSACIYSHFKWYNNVRGVELLFLKTVEVTIH